jgi:AraC-like DNA-binding protein
MLSLLVITCIIFQTAVAMFLLNGVRVEDVFEKHLRALLLILLVHLSTKFLLLAVLKDPFLYAQIPTGFGLAYGPLLLVITRSAMGRPIRPRLIVCQFLPFFTISLVYVFLVIAGTAGAISRSAIARYAAWYEWLVILSLYGYPLYVRSMLWRNNGKGDAKELPSAGRQLRLTAQMANIQLTGISAGLLLFALNWTAIKIPGFDLRLLPYICFAAIPVLILRYRLQKNEQLRVEEKLEEKNGGAEKAGEIGGEERAAEIILTPVCPPLTPETPERHQDRRYEKSGMDSARMDVYEAALAAYMEKSRIWLDPDLSLELLAARMKMPKHHLTQLLNERVMKNFYNYVNEYRIGEAMARLNNPALQVNILSLAFDCGFNSRSSFNNYFKKITGFTPSAYRKLQIEQRGPVTRATARPGRLIPGTSPSV